MRLTKYMLLTMVLLFCGMSSFSQIKVYQLSGLVVNKNTRDVVPFAKVSINKSRRGTVCNNEGFYSIPVVEGDTIYFSSLGYRPSILIFSEYLANYKGDVDGSYIYSINYLTEDSIYLPDILILPYTNAAELKAAIIETDVPEDIESINARNNMNPEVMDRMISTLHVDEGERIMVARQLYYNQQLHQHVAPTMPLFDPVAVYQLLKYINDKTKEKKNRNLDYWND